MKQLIFIAMALLFTNSAISKVVLETVSLGNMVVPKFRTGNNQKKSIIFKH